MTIGKKILPIAIGATLLIGCSSTPDGVLPQEDMAQLLADIHIGESMVDIERTKYYNDSLRKTVKQSILLKHGATQAELDSSFSWYGRNIEEYIAVYDRVIEILNDDLKDIGSGIQEKVGSTQEGDSTDTWQGVRRYMINHNSASQYITFSIPKDRNTEKGDNFSLRMKLINNPSSIKWGIAADYSDGSTEYLNANAINEGWNTLSIVTDSTKSINKIYGYFYVIPKEFEQVYIDSISLIRMRVDRNLYRQRATQKKFEYGKNKNTSDQKNTTDHDNKKGTIDAPKAKALPIQQPNKPSLKTRLNNTEPL